MAGRRTLFVFVALGLALVTSLISGNGTSFADHMMCSQAGVEKRTQTVSIDPDLAGTGLTKEDVIASFKPWNDLFFKYHGFAIFAEHHGDWREADVLLTAHGGWSRTWVSNRCVPGFVQRGNNHTVLFVGRDDSWRNREFISHELGHALGFGDHGSDADQTQGHVGFLPCGGRYMGVMSYCTGQQSWFLDFSLQGTILDAQLVQSYAFGRPLG